MALKDSSNEYADIIHLPHHTSKTRPRMSMHDRAAQFSPFSALTGHEAAIRETARLTEGRIELDEIYKMELDEKLLMILSHLKQRPTVSITYFKKDEKKAGGSYEEIRGVIRTVDLTERTILMENRSKIPIDDIVDIDSEILSPSFL